MKVQMTACDNPDCDEITDDEAYGWLTGSLTYIGSGPTVDVVVCSPACLEGGVDCVRDRQYYDGVDQRRRESQEIEQYTLSVRCPRCDAKPGSPCMTSKGNHAPTVHSGRRTLGIEAWKEYRHDTDGG